ncbi:MAG: DNA-processing protein DprA [Deltaproteobacteria bacterium]|nr:DNA-processing protein DprA [Deltaproteobacteria bacterium]
MTPHQENLLALALVDGLGARAIQRLLERFGSPLNVLAQPPAALQEAGLKPELAERVTRAADNPLFVRERRLMADRGVRLVAWGAPDYPERLARIDPPPPLLFVRGVWPLPPGPALAVVGTRRATRYGEESTRRLIASTARLTPGLVVVSGLARGVDTFAHQQALELGLNTVAVMGGGLADIYPPENTRLAERIAQQGALVSEFPMSKKPLARNFPIRNRIISGLSDVILVTEAGEKSGALITAGFGANQRRPVFAVPGNIDQPASLGTNRLLAQGLAFPALGPEGLAQGLANPAALAPMTPQGKPARQLSWLDSAGYTASSPATRSQPSAQKEKSLPPLPPEKAAVAAALGGGPRHPDDLSQELNLPVERLLGLLLELELEGITQALPDHRHGLAG